MDSPQLDDLDRRLTHAFQLDGRVPFSRLAEVLGVSDQTVARRYHRLRSTGVLRVVGVPEATKLGRVVWLLRVRCMPDAASAIATALARRDDTSWVNLTSAGTEITCYTSAPRQEADEGLLLGQLPRTPRVVSVTAHRLLRRFAGGPAGWPGRASALDAAQVAALTTAWEGSAVSPRLEPGDDALFTALAHDGRASLATLAAVSGRSETTVRRRLEHLRSSGALYFDVEVDAALLGASLSALLWLSVSPSRLDAVAREVATYPEVALVAATTGPTNLTLSIGCRDDDALYDFLATRLGALPGVHQVETAPMIRTIKRSGSWVAP
ncbi:AsnC family transcriptional regulator [Amycolatopsis carbonis]|uniref:AsnC family transcriptional regulator n=1 Tax=Amycolatopsis carbonis TaxID=715471 RepID=A0A9Y2MZS9_9PSEU|nr:AsnC family transcriptional regulator [Amycolatopsis sp. 2-15]WIX81252.1 AsnC family transcriptional regulator [Amycolatopsis sp. 2-15]